MCLTNISAQRRPGFMGPFGQLGTPGIIASPFENVGELPSPTITKEPPEVPPSVDGPLDLLEEEFPRRFPQGGIGFRGPRFSLR